MKEQFESLTEEEKRLLYKAPVLVSVLASCSLNEVNKAQKADAIKLAHLKTFTAAPLLLSYYAEVENGKRNLSLINISKIAVALKVEINKLITLKEIEKYIIK